MFLRIPGWCVDGAQVTVNGYPSRVTLVPGEYAQIKNTWHKGDIIELTLPMPVKMVEANPLVEEVRNQVEVKRGPVVYCIESSGTPADTKIFGVSISSRIDLVPQNIIIDNSKIVALTGKANLENASWKNQLYRNVAKKNERTVNVQLIPYFAWGNRGHTEMETWIPFSR